MNADDFVMMALLLSIGAGGIDAMFDWTFAYQQRRDYPVALRWFVFGFATVGQLPALFSLRYMNAQIYHFADTFGGTMSAGAIFVFVFGILPFVATTIALRIVTWWIYHRAADYLRSAP